MGIKKMFKKKEPSEQELVEDLSRLGISTNTHNQRPDKFSAFKSYAQERANAKPELAPVNPYANVNGESNESNPYAQNDAEEENDPYAERSERPQNPDSANPYAKSSHGSSPYGSTASSAASQRVPRASSAASQRANPYASKPPSYSSRISRQSTRSTMGSEDTESLDLNEVPTNQPPVNYKPIRRPRNDDETLDLNDDEDDLDLNLEYDDEALPEEEEINSEDEEVEGIKQEIKFVKGESLASTRNTLRMAQEADASGTNTLGMLGSQSERLYNAEQNLLLSGTQTKIAEEKVKEIQRLNRSIFIPATSVNPFNKKSRLRQQEAKIKTDKAQEKYMRESNRAGVYASEQRLKQGITNSATSSDIHAKYQGEKNLQQAQRYQFENDSEDDEMEKELASNLDQISSYAKKLKSSANIMGQEVDTQNTRLRKIEDDADELDINVHLNNTRLNNIR